MATQNDLRTDYKDSQYIGKKKFKMIENDDSTVSFEDVTEYTQVGDNLTADDVNNMNEVIKYIDIKQGEPVNMSGVGDKNYTQTFGTFDGNSRGQYYLRCQNVPTGYISLRASGVVIGNFYIFMMNKFSIPAQDIMDTSTQEKATQLTISHGFNINIDIGIMNFGAGEGLRAKLESDFPEILYVIEANFGKSNPFAKGRIIITNETFGDILNAEVYYYATFSTYNEDMIEVYCGFIEDIDISLEYDSLTLEFQMNEVFPLYYYKGTDL